MNSLQPMDLSPIGRFMEIPSEVRNIILNCYQPEQSTPELIKKYAQDVLSLSLTCKENSELGKQKLEQLKIMYELSRLPKTLVRHSQKIKFKNKEEAYQLIKGIAERVSDIYASFLTFGCNHDSHLVFFGIPIQFPQEEKVRLFKDNLKNTIIKKLCDTIEEAETDSIRLSTDYAPEHLLDDVLTISKISFHDYELHKLFPIKTSTRIWVCTSRKRIEISMTSQ